MSSQEVSHLGIDQLQLSIASACPRACLGPFLLQWTRVWTEPSDMDKPTALRAGKFSHNPRSVSSQALRWVYSLLGQLLALMGWAPLLPQGQSVLDVGSASVLTDQCKDGGRSSIHSSVHSQSIHSHPSTQNKIWKGDICRFFSPPVLKAYT